MPRAPGVFRGPCAEYCGGPHALMALQVNGDAPRGFRRRGSPENKPAPWSPASTPSERGRLFFSPQAAVPATLCGALRRRARSDRTSRIIGSRRSIGADTLPLDRDNLIRFIVEGQKIKPSNKMPEFRIFTELQRNAIGRCLPPELEVSGHGGHIQQAGNRVSQSACRARPENLPSCNASGLRRRAGGSSATSTTQ